MKQLFYLLWQLPQTIVALLMLPFMGKINLIQYTDYCWILQCSKMKGGISLGCFILLSKYSTTPEIISHELGHTKQSKYLSWLYLFIIGLPSILNATFHFTNNYYDFYTEKWSNKLMGLSTDKNGKLFFLN